MNEIKKQQLLRILQEDLRSAKMMREKLDGKINEWKREYNGEPYGNEVKGRSQLVSRDIKKQVSWQHSAIVEPFVSTPDIIQALPVSYEDAPKAPKIGLLLNTQFCRQFNRFKFVHKLCRVLLEEGTAVIRTGWEFEEKEVEELIDEEVDNPQYVQISQMLNQLVPLAQQGNEQALGQAQQLHQAMQSIPAKITQQRVIKKVLPIKNNPTAMVCKNADIFIDPTCGDNFDDAQFVIHRFETNISNLKKEGIYTNLDRVQAESLGKDSDGFTFNGDKTNFEFKDSPRKKLVVYEYWGNYDINDDGIAEPIVCSWVGNTIIRLGDNPFPDKKPPFIPAPLDAIPYSLHGEALAEDISDIQKIKTAIYRGFIDNMALSNNGQKGLRKGALDSVNKRRFLNGENFEFNGTPNDFFDGHFNELPSSIFNVLQLMNNETESITGIASYNTGINGNSLGQTSTGIRAAVDSASSRRLNIVRGISENLIKPLLRKWLAYSSEFLDEESQIRITNDEFVWIKREDLEARIDIDLTISTSDDNQAKASELAFMLQTIGPSEDPKIRQIIMSNIARLYRMPELAKLLENYEPTPDPAAQKMSELQIALLEAQVANERAKANENEMDLNLKEAKAETERAKARNLGATADKTDLDYLQQYYGTKEKREESIALQAQRHQLARDFLQMRNKQQTQYL